MRARAPVQQVQGDVTLSNEFHWSTFKLEEVNIGGVRVEMLPTDTSSAGACRLILR